MRLRKNMFHRNTARFAILLITLVIAVVLFSALHSNNQATPEKVSMETYVHRNAKADRELGAGMRLCPRLKRPDGSKIRTLRGYWQYHGSVETEEIIVYSAFFDDRPLLGLSTWIRVWGMAANFSSGGLYCHLWYEDQPNPYVTQAVLNVTGRKNGYRLGKKVFVQYMFSCRLTSSHPLPSHVSLVGDQCDNSSILLPIQRPVKSIPEHEFGLCVAVSFGTIPVPQFVEWIELHHMFGVTEFNVYDADMTGMTEVFEYYIKRGWLKVFPAPPALKLTGVDGPKLGSPAALNDCMMRNLYRYRLVLVIDFDEVIIPRMHRDYFAMLAYIEKVVNVTEQTIGYGFRNAFFFRDLRPDPKQPAYLWTMGFRSRSVSPNHRKAPKSFVDPLKCLSIFNHYCYISLKTWIRPLYLSVDPSIAVSHHYRLCGYEEAVCRSLLNSTYEDRTALLFKNDLQPRVKMALQQLGALPAGKHQ